MGVRKFSDDEEIFIAAHYVHKMSLREIANHFDTNQETVRNILKRRGVKIRTKKQGTQIYKKERNK